jgi:hypothetical protein
MSASRRFGLSAIAIVAVATAGCQRKDRDPERRPDAERRVARVEKPPPPVRILNETVLTRGQEPRRLLRYRPAGEHELIRTVTATLTEIEDGEKRAPRAMPAITHRFALIGTGSRVLDVGVAKPEIAGGKPPPVTELARAQTRRFEVLLAGRKARLAADDRGVMGDVAGLSGSEEARRELAAALVDAFVVLPDVPVGVGARWRIERAVPRVRTHVKQRATYEIASIKDGVIELEVELLTVGERQPITLPGPPGSVSELLALRVFQTGTLTVDLASPTAVAGALDRRDTVHMRSTMQQKTVRDYFAESKSEVKLRTTAK